MKLTGFSQGVSLADASTQNFLEFARDDGTTFRLPISEESMKIMVAEVYGAKKTAAAPPPEPPVYPEDEEEVEPDATQFGAEEEEGNGAAEHEEDETEDEEEEQDEAVEAGFPQSEDEVPSL
jgi:hypothetical protein